MPSYDDWTAADQALFLGSTGDSSYDTPRTASTVTSDILTQGQAITGGGSDWSGFWQGLVKTVVTAKVIDNSNKTQIQTAAQLQAARAQSTQLPLYSSNGGGLQISPVLLIGIGLVVVLMMKK